MESRMVGEVTVREAGFVEACPLLWRVAVTVVLEPGIRLGLAGEKEMESMGA